MYVFLTATERNLLFNKAGLVENFIWFVVEGSVTQSQRDSLMATFLKVHAGFYCTVQEKLWAFLTSLFCGGVCGLAVNTLNSGSGGPGFKPRSSCCFLRQGTLLHFISFHPGA